MASATLNARLRDSHGKGAARKLRAAGQVPAVLYGHGDANRPLALNALEVEKLFKSISVENTVVTLTMDGGATADALVREVQTHPFKPEVLHVDFIQLHAGEPIKLNVPVRLVGTPVGVHTAGGVLDQVIYDVEIQCLPRDIPEAAQIDVSDLDMGQQVHVSDINLPGVTISLDPDVVIATIAAPRVASLDAPDTVDEGSPEPELTRTENNEEGGEA